MKKIILLTSCLSLMACADLTKNNPNNNHPHKHKKELYTDIKSPYVTDLNFNKKGKLPKDIENEQSYNINISGTAIDNCVVTDYADIQITSSGANQIFIGDASDWDIVRIDCRDIQGKGKVGEKYNLNIELYGPTTTYKGSAEVLHE